MPSVGTVPPSPVITIPNAELDVIVILEQALSKEFVSVNNLIETKIIEELLKLTNLKLLRLHENQKDVYLANCFYESHLLITSAEIWIEKSLKELEGEKHEETGNRERPNKN
jgi:hypothetical protein